MTGPPAEARRVRHVEAHARVVDHAPLRKRRAGVVLHLRFAGVGVQLEIDQRIAGRLVGIVGRVGIGLDVLQRAVGAEVAVIDDGAELQALLGRQPDVQLDQAGNRILPGVGNGYAVAIFIVVGLVMADRTGQSDTAGLDAGRQHLAPADPVGAVAERAHDAGRVAGLDDVVHAERTQVRRAGQRARATRRRTGAAHDVHAGEQRRIDIGKALGLVRREAEILAHAVDHHVDAARTLEAADVHGEAGVLRIFRGGRTRHGAQHVAGVELPERLDVAPGRGADRGRRVVDGILLGLLLGGQALGLLHGLGRLLRRGFRRALGGPLLRRRAFALDRHLRQGGALREGLRGEHQRSCRAAPQQQACSADPNSDCLIGVANCSAACAAYATPVHGPMPLYLRDRKYSAGWRAEKLTGSLAGGLAALLGACLPFVENWSQ